MIKYIITNYVKSENKLHTIVTRFYNINYFCKNLISI